MISDITLGQYFPGYSVIHKLDPRTKILVAVIAIVGVFLVNNIVGFVFLTLCTIGVVSISRIPFLTVMKGVKPIVFILIFTAILNVFLTKGSGDPLVSFWIINIYTDGIIRAVVMALRVMVLIILSCMLLTYTTSPISLTDGLESLLSPLKKIKVPVHTFAMMMSIALRFIPTLVEETEKIMNAQKSRGADFSSGSLIKRTKALIPLIIPLILSSFNRAEELATAMECRCYRGDKNRTKLVKLEFKIKDIFAFIITLAFLAGIILLSTLPYSVEHTDTVMKILFYKV